MRYYEPISEWIMNFVEIVIASIGTGFIMTLIMIATMIQTASFITQNHPDWLAKTYCETYIKDTTK